MRSVIWPLGMVLFMKSLTTFKFFLHILYNPRLYGLCSGYKLLWNSFSIYLFLISYFCYTGSTVCHLQKCLQVFQVVKCLLCKHEALSLKPSHTKKKNKNTCSIVQINSPLHHSTVFPSTHS
jgi:hypothetical protein